MKKNTMIKPQFLTPDNTDHTIVGKIFDTPLVVKGWTGLPLTQLLVWAIMAREAGRLHPERSWRTRFGVAALTMPVILGSEWCHNLAHAAAAKFTGHPVDAIRINFGMPLLIYYDIEDASVTPRQHIIRALGGPIFNTAVWTMAALARFFTPRKSAAREVVNAALYMNAFLVIIGMLPIPGIDGGAVLKWSLVERGQTLTEADESVKKVNAVTGVVLNTAAAAAFKKRKRFLGGIFAMLGISALLVGLGVFKEKA
jgi:Zn-dependent protease